ncbi:alpha/beta hydrolase [Salinibius halmophilus]|uniref:alpha/beta hydrolase n=1 Tax=Salinibius halmophilus TaxID=1853216 RepID=UPI000E66955F|nr:alpha/beta fold hydrolase [Salinibius halmophilus]
MSHWGLRDILAPVTTRLTLFGTNPVDIEAALQHIEAAKILRATDLETHWQDFWQAKAQRYLTLAKQSPSKLGSSRFHALVTHCMHAMFLINYHNQATKRQHYQAFAEHYQASLLHHVEHISLPLNDQQQISALLHLPKHSSPYACTILFAGLGSCKEEMQMLVEPMLARGIAVLVPDLPGCGTSIYQSQIPCTREQVDTAVKAAVDYVANRSDIEANKIGTAGLCMGGGIAFMAATADSRITYCATLFPLLISEVDQANIPQWMTSGHWFELVSGGQDKHAFIESMGLPDNATTDANFLMIHSQHDNWMTEEMALEAFYQKAKGQRQQITVTDAPVISALDGATHAMPVGEQMHWCKEVMADWIIEQVS